MTERDRDEIVGMVRRQYAELGRAAGRSARCHVWVLGDIAVALAGCGAVNDRPTARHDVSGYLLTRTPEGWRIAAQNWKEVPDIAEAFAAAEL